MMIIILVRIRDDVELLAAVGDNIVEEYDGAVHGRKTMADFFYYLIKKIKFSRQFKNRHLYPHLTTSAA